MVLICFRQQQSVDMFPHTDEILDMFPHMGEIYTAVSVHVECVVLMSRDQK